MSERTAIANSRRVVIKIGSALLTANGQGLDRAGIANWVEQIVALHKQGIQIVLVSSGAVAEGMARLGWQERPEAIHNLQAAAAVGQMGLVQAYESCFQQHGIHTAQILLVHDDVSNRTRYLNSRNTLQALLALGVVPVVNENDTVVTEEIRFGDNDTLGALVANLVDADALIILTDQEGVFERDPRQDPAAPLITRANANDPKLDEMAGGSSGPLGRGGMITKIRAARIAARSGSHTIIAYGRRPNVLRDIFTAQAVGTLLVADQQPLAARKKWLAGQLKASGTLILDDGAVKVVRDAGKSLLAVGVSDVQGDFARGEMVLCTSSDGNVIARGLVNYSADELRQIMGRRSHEITALLGYHDGDEVVHRDNLVLT